MFEFLLVRFFFRNGNREALFVATAATCIIVIVGIIIVAVYRRRRLGLLKINTTLIYVPYLYRKKFRFTSLNKILCGHTIRDTFQKLKLCFYFQ